MTKDEALRLAQEFIPSISPAFICEASHHKKHEQHASNEPCPHVAKQKQVYEAIKAALLSQSDGEAKDEKANDELRRLHDLLGKANALARIRANKIDELEQRLTKTEAQLGEAVWNYGELKREQLANQQKTSGSPINTSTALEAKDEPVAWMYDWTTSEGEFIQNWTTSEAETLRDTEPTIITNVRPLYTTPPQRTWVWLTNEEHMQLAEEWGCLSADWVFYAAAVERKIKERNT